MASLKEIRTSRGVSQEDLAERIGVSRQTVSKWESGDARPSADNLMRLSQVFQLPVEAFLRSDWKPPEQQAVEAAVILPETPPEPDGDPAPPSVDVPQAPVDEAPPPRHRYYRFWAALAAILAVAAIIAGVISFSRRDVDAIPIEEVERREVDQFQINTPGTLQPLQP